MSWATAYVVCGPLRLDIATAYLDAISFFFLFPFVFKCVINVKICLLFSFFFVSYLLYVVMSNYMDILISDLFLSFIISVLIICV